MSLVYWINFYGFSVFDSEVNFCADVIVIYIVGLLS